MINATCKRQLQDRSLVELLFGVCFFLVCFCFLLLFTKIAFREDNVLRSLVDSFCFCFLLFCIRKTNFFSFRREKADIPVLVLNCIKEIECRGTYKYYIMNNSTYIDLSNCIVMSVFALSGPSYIVLL